MLAASSRLDDQMAGNKVCSAETTQRPIELHGAWDIRDSGTFPPCN